MKSIDCQPANETYPVKVSDMRALYQNDTIFLNGKIEILEVMPMNIEMEMTVMRCNLDLTGCYLFEKIVFSRICEKMKIKTSIAFKILSGIHPAPHCPIAKGTYEMMNDSKFSMETFKILPLEGYLWNSRNVFYEKIGAKRVRSLACLEYDITVNVAHRTKAKH